MAMKMRLLPAMAIVLLAGMLLSGGLALAAGNLLSNGNFERLDGQRPEGWSTEEWIKEDGVTVYSIDRENVYSGSASIVVRNEGENHARWIQNVKVNENKLYRISGYVKAEGIGENGAGALLQVEGVYAEYPEVRDTGGEWAFVQFYGRTGSGQTEITVGASVGGYGSINTGTAWFDDLSVEEVAEAPEGAAVIPLSATPAGAAEEKEPEKVSIGTTLACAALFAALFAVVYARLFREDGLRSRRPSLVAVLLYAAFAAALALRVGIGVSHGGYANDMALFIYWSEQAVAQGISGFYHADFFVDYPPGYIYVLYALGHLKEWLGLAPGSAGLLLLYKLPAIAADLAAAAVVWRMAGKKLGTSAALGLTALYLFNPAVIADSAAWGQVDAVFALALVMSIAALTEKRIARASVWYAIAALIKPQAFIFMPVLLLALLLNRKWRDVLVSAYYGFATFILLALPFFWGNGGLPALYRLYQGTLSSYPYATLNAFNLYALNGANWKPLEDVWLFMSYGAWGNLFIAAAVAAAAYFALIRNGAKREDRSFFIAAAIIAIVFLLVTKMHERYMFPVILLSLMAYMQMKDRRMLHVFLGFSLTNFINISYVLAYSPQTSNVAADGVVLVCSIANLGLLLYMLYVGYDVYAKGRQVPVEPFTADDRRKADVQALGGIRGEEEGGRPALGRYTRKDWLLMGAVTAIYAVVALIGLGSMKAPATAWQPAASGQSFYVDLGEPKRLERVMSFGGVGTGKYKLEFGLTPEQWTNSIEVDSSHVFVFAWKHQNVDVEARYVKLTAVQSGFSIHELGIYEKGSKEPLAVQAVQYDQAAKAKRGTPELLFDEQDLMIYTHSYMKGSYFDEIYHARTAYENLEGIVAYENTHPPLGKLIIALGIKLFGLGPYGWRIMGTLLGIAMVPIIYAMARHLFRSRSLAMFAAGLLAADFMHFTQTRISTIDVYGVFFIMLMFYWMSRYSSMNFYRHKLAATWLPLGLAGLAFGLGVASKWIVLYGGAGLAVMLALSLWDRYREYAAAKRQLNGGGEDVVLEAAELKRIVRVFPKYTVLTLAVCLVFYVAVPAAIYALSYIPILSVMQGGYTLQALVDYQVNMFNYHSNLVSSHPFSSSWWEWPFMKRPVWYYNGGELAEGMKSTIAAMGNPLLWWSGIFCMLAAIYISVKRRDKRFYMVWIAFLAQYVPWMLVPRETFLYHYFAMVPFILLSIVYMFRFAEERMPRLVKLRHAYLAAAAALFVLFYPALSGMQVPVWYINMLRWFPSWLF